jgi:monoamine oxidase
LVIHGTHFLIVGAGAAGLMTARELARSGKKVTILEARDRCGGRIYPLSAGPGEVPIFGTINYMHEGAGDLGSLKLNGYFRSFPHRDR